MLQPLNKRTEITSLVDISQVTTMQSCTSGRAPTSVVPFYDWSGFFDNDKVIKTAIKGISRMHHFRFPYDKPGCVFIKNSSDGAEHNINLLKETSWRPSATDLPEVITIIN